VTQLREHRDTLVGLRGCRASISVRGERSLPAIEQATGCAYLAIATMTYMNSGEYLDICAMVDFLREGQGTRRIPAISEHGKSTMRYSYMHGFCLPPLGSMTPVHMLGRTMIASRGCELAQSEEDQSLMVARPRPYGLYFLLAAMELWLWVHVLYFQ
jgi:hypothetical protein